MPEEISHLENRFETITEKLDEVPNRLDNANQVIDRLQTENLRLVKERGNATTMPL